LPGTILGITVPRLYTSWIATKVMVNGVDVNLIKPLSEKKTLTNSEFTSLVMERAKDFYIPDDPDEKKEAEQRKTLFIWEALL
jgi:hypothetical protein